MSHVSCEDVGQTRKAAQDDLQKRILSAFGCVRKQSHEISLNVALHARAWFGTKSGVPLLNLRLEAHVRDVRCVGCLNDVGRHAQLHRMIFKNGSDQPSAV